MNSLNIQFNNQVKNVKGLLSEALHSGYMADVTLVSDDLKHISAHKFILAACSPVFRSILIDDSSKSHILYLKGISSEFIRIMLKFVYSGEVNIDSLEAPTFMKILQEFQIQDLGDMKSTESHSPADNERSSQESVMMTQESDDISQESEHRGNETKELKIDQQGEFLPEIRDQSNNLNSKETPCSNTLSKKFHCPDCTYVSQNASNFKVHRSRMHKIERKYPCETCGKFYTEIAHLNDHIRKVHENRFPCVYCDHESTQKSSLRMHIEAKHKGIKHTCKHCGKRFSKSGLHSHMKTDHEGKRFHCEYCNHQFTQKSGLKIHIETKHNGIKHTCDQCGKSFSQSGTLKIHIKTKHIN